MSLRDDIAQAIGEVDGMPDPDDWGDGYRRLVHGYADAVLAVFDADLIARRLHRYDPWVQVAAEAMAKAVAEIDGDEQTPEDWMGVAEATVEALRAWCEA